MADFQQYLIADRKLFILRLLGECGGKANASVIRSALHQAGHTLGVTKDAVHQYLMDLRDKGAVSLDWFDDTVCVASLTARGSDASKGIIEIKGISPPSIGG